MKTRIFLLMLMLGGFVQTMQAQSFDDVYGGSEQRYDSYNKKKRKQQANTETYNQNEEENYD
ncbi:MAG: hypothetical protein FGM54_02390, partial [Chitinophagaceae bacterium]|nr:hypothetical protein [Chitinophagaceae bacterium]